MEFLVFLGLLLIDVISQIYHQETAWLTYWLPELFAKNALFWTVFFLNRGLRLAPIYSKKHLKHDSMPFFH